MKTAGAIENIYNVTPNVDKAAFIIVAQVEEYRIDVSLTLTSTMMREEPSPEQAKGEEGSWRRDGRVHPSHFIGPLLPRVLPYYFRIKNQGGAPCYERLPLLRHCVKGLYGYLLALL